MSSTVETALPIKPTNSTPCSYFEYQLYSNLILAIFINIQELTMSSHRLYRSSSAPALMSQDIPNRLSTQVNPENDMNHGLFQSFPELDISQTPGLPNQGYMVTPAYLANGFVESVYGDLKEKNNNQACGNLVIEPINAISSTGLFLRHSTSIIFPTTPGGTLNPAVLNLRGNLSSEEALTLRGPLGFGGALSPGQAPSLGDLNLGGALRFGGPLSSVGHLNFAGHLGSAEPLSLQDIPVAAEVPGDSSSSKASGNWPGYENNPPRAKKESPDTVERPRITTKTSELTLRGQKMQNFKAEEFYQELPETPPSWSSPGKKFVFEYNQYGELANGIRLSKDQMEDFLFNHPLNRNCKSGKGSLILWVQSAPVDSYNRYPTQKSDKCRFSDCPARYNTIHKGFFRVAIDEQNQSGLKINPYYCAGVVHLYCLEKFMDFSKLCREINIQPDNRSLPEPRNKMAITRDYQQLFGIVDDFVKKSRSQPTQDSQSQPWDYTKTLSHLLTEKCLELEPRVRQRMRVEGNHRGRHRGDLMKFVQGEREKNAKRRSGGKGRDESDSEESSQPHKRKHTVK
jgi:hypothetical protein